MDSYQTMAVVFGIIFWLVLVILGIYFAVIISGGRKKILSILFAAFGVIFPIFEIVPISIGAATAWD